MQSDMSSNDQRRDRWFFRLVRRRWPIIVACVLVVPAAAVCVSLLQPKRYSASATLLFRDPALDQKLFGSSVFQPSGDPARAAATNLQLVSLGVVATRTARALGVSTSQVQSKVNVSPEGIADTALIRATDSSPIAAARLANTFADQYVAFRRSSDQAKVAGALRLVQGQLGRLSRSDLNGPVGRSLRSQANDLATLRALQTGNAEVVQHATAPSQPSSPKPVRNGLIGLVLGLVLGFVLAIAFDRWDKRVMDSDEFEAIFARPTLATIPESKAFDSTQDGFTPLPGREAEALRLLRANLRYFDVEHRISSVLVTSSMPGDGKTTVAVALSAAAADAGQNVLLVEADLRHTSLARRLGAPPAPGLSDALLDSSDLGAAGVAVVSRTDTGSLSVLTSGGSPPDPARLLESPRMARLLTDAESKYDFVVVDAPPLLAISDAIPLTRLVSGVLVVGRLRSTPRDAAARLHEQLERLDAPVLGVVVNGATSMDDYYGLPDGYLSD